MKASDLHLPELLEMDPKGGTIRFNERRMLLWDADAFGSLRKELIECLGIESARPILKRFGFANGVHDAGMTENMGNWDSDAEWWRSCPALQRHEGKVAPDVKHLVVDREHGIFELEVQWTHSYEAEQHTRILGPTDSPVCWTLAGYASGFASAMMGEKCIAIETECVAMGAERCRVVGKTHRAWGRAGQDFALDYEESDKVRADDGDEFVSRSRCMEDVLNLCRIAAKLTSSVLFSGEVGVGKSKLARLLHSVSPNNQAAFLRINCASLPETLLDSELFGHVKGAFDGANEDKVGALECVGAGTIFLEEVANLPPATQIKLLRALQEREVWPLGGSEPRKMNARIVASTHHDLDARVTENSFRPDLLARLRTIVVQVPPLRARPEDLLPLAKRFLRRLCKQAGCREKCISVDAAQALASHTWPGNLRELENALERALMLCGDGDVIEREHLSSILGSVESQLSGTSVEIIPIAEIERRYVLEVLDRYDGNRTKTAKALGIGANTLWRKLKGWGVPPARGEASFPPSFS